VLTGLGLVGLGFMTGQTLGQGQQDENVRRSASNSSSAAPKATVPPVIGTIDMDRVLKEYEKFKFLGEEFQASVLAKKNELMKLGTEMQQQAEAMQKWTPGTPEFKKHEDKITFLKAQMDAKKEQAQREFELKEADSLATLYKEIQEMASRVAHQRRMTYVLKVSNQSISGGDPKSVMAAMSSTVIYSDPHNDISSDVIYHLNRQYRANGGQPPKAAAPATARAAQPGAATGAQPAAGATRGLQR
jgi:outer membrane protein